MSKQKKIPIYYEKYGVAVICMKNDDGSIVVENTCDDKGVWYWSGREVMHMEYEFNNEPYWQQLFYDYFGDSND